MKPQVVICTLMLALGSATIAHAADKASAPAPAMTPEQKAMAEAYERMGAVRAEHQQFSYFVGNWKTDSTMWMDPKSAPEKSAGTAKGELLYSGRYLRLQHQGVSMGQAFSGEGLLGFDNLKGKFFSTWMDSMSTGVWLAYGSYDAASKAYTFTGEMDDPMKAGAKIPIREVIRVADNTHYSFEWWETRNGKEAKTMQVDYTRQ